MRPPWRSLKLQEKQSAHEISQPFFFSSFLYVISAFLVPDPIRIRNTGTPILKKRMVSLGSELKFQTQCDAHIFVTRYLPHSCSPDKVVPVAGPGATCSPAEPAPRPPPHPASSTARPPSGCPPSSRPSPGSGPAARVGKNPVFLYIKNQPSGFFVFFCFFYIFAQKREFLGFFSLKNTFRCIKTLNYNQSY